MAKKKAGNVKGKTNKIRRTVLGTLSGIFMISALIVAAIPVKDVEAVDPNQIPFTDNYSVDLDGSVIPNYSSAPVYFREDGTFGVASVITGSDLTGVLVYYNLDAPNQGTVSIPEKIEAYQHEFNPDDGVNYLRPVYTDGGFLWYMPESETDVSGNEIFDVSKLEKCYANNHDAWKGKTLYTQDGTPREQLTIPVSYIGSTRYVLDVEIGQEARGHYFGASDTGEKGVFVGATNFTGLTIPKWILAIGDDAFKGCQMTSVSIGDGVKGIGNHAFDGCNLLTSVKLTESGATNLKEIGSYAFANCRSLTSIDIPDQVQSIGSGCFMECTALSAANLYGHNTATPGNTSLTRLGNGAFYNCSSLRNMYLPLDLGAVDNAEYWFFGCSALVDLTLPDEPGNFKASNVTGCYNLLTVTVPDATMTFDCDHSLDDYCDGTGSDDTFGRTNLGYKMAFGDYQVDDRFCIISFRGSPAYYYACRHEYSVGYLNPDELGKFERVKDNYCFTIDNEGNLTHLEPYKSNGNVKIVNIPDHVGSFDIKAIDSKFLSTFSRKDEIEYVHIPESVVSIGAESFKGCEELSEVEFANSMAVQEIGEGAFDTETMDGDIKLHFVGDVSREGVESQPFLYAMEMGNNYNHPNNPKGTKYIAYTSPFPYNLQIELVVEKDETTGQVVKATPTLIDAPDFEENFKTGDYSLTSNPELKEEQNAIVRSAYTKYREELVSGNSNVVYSDNEAAVLDAVFRVTIPEGVYNMNADVYKGNEYISSVILNSVTDVPDGAFAGCSSLKSFIMRSSEEEGGERIGAKVFEDDDLLTTVILPATLEDMDSLPFYRCSALEGVDFAGSPKFSCNNGIIYEKKDDGTQKIVECLELRGDKVSTSTISEEELANVSEIEPRAFEGCESIKQVLFGNAPLRAIPEYCFNNCRNLYYCEVSDQTEDIGDYAFRNTALTGIKIPEKTSFISGTAFVLADEVTGETELIPGLIIECENPSAAYTYADHYGFTVKKIEIPEYQVEFYNYDGSVLLDTQTVKQGADAVPPEAPAREGWVHTGWFPDYKNVTSNLQIKAEYEPEPDDPVDTRPVYTVIFYNYDGSLKISTQKVREGDAAKAPSTVPEREGYTFTGWLPEFDNIIEDTNVYAQYKRGSSDGSGNPGADGNPGTPGTPGAPGTSGTPGTPGTSGTPGAGGNNGSNGSNGTNGGGSGSSNKGSVSGNNANRTNGSGGTKVNVNKSGISNANLISATVNGSSDDYIVKITDSESARNAVEQALLNEYGSLDNIRYFAMDISLYDKTGTTKIQNTDGITVKITMPIPDALVSYAGNNKAGAVVGNNTLEKLQANFTTIDGVPCISFVAKHFSPYTIYVDLDHMSANGTIDSTPVTGDPIHPKWFLSIGLALMSVMLFFMKGSKGRVVKVIPG